MLLIRNITNIPISVGSTSIDPGTSKKLDIEYSKTIRSLERAGSISVVQVGSTVDNTPITAVKRRSRRKEATEEVGSLTESSDTITK